MGFYYLSSMAWEGDLINFPDSKGRLFDFFIQNKGDGRFLQYTKPRGYAQDNFSVAKIKKADYLPVIMGIPVFSEKAKNIFERKIPDEMSFYECIIECDGDETIFFIGKVNSYLPLVNNDKSSYRKLSDNRNVICKPFFDYQGTFFIARDEVYSHYLVVSGGFVEICKKENIKMIDFLVC